MPAPAVPDFTPFDPTDQPNLTAGGAYDQFLTQLEEYLGQLKTYIDSMGDLNALQSEVDSLQNTVSNMTSVQYQSPSGTNYPLFTAAGAAGTALTQISAGIDEADTAASAAQGTAEAAQTAAETAQSGVNTINGYTYNVPRNINTAGNGVNTTSENLNLAIQALCLIVSSIMLAAPNGDQSALLGYLGSNSEDLNVATPTVRSSAALTSASETGGVGFTMGSSDAQLSAGNIASDAKLAPVEGESGKYVVYVDTAD